MQWPSSRQSIFQSKIHKIQDEIGTSESSFDQSPWPIRNEISIFLVFILIIEPKLEMKLAIS